MPALILIVSTALLFVYFQAVCQKILRRRFTQEYFQTIVNANRLEFPSVQRSIEDFGASVRYSRLTVMLKCDFVVLTYLLKNVNNVYQRFTYEERLLILYFRVLFVSLIMRHWLRLRENSAVLNLVAILEYFANVVGERIDTVRFGNLKGLLNI
ncbi:MAG TPA: hypothetical protein VEN79_00770 [Terriglobia bacterium]|nr:hypothetical protein [Terriglobia bacterium]